MRCPVAACLAITLVTLACGARPAASPTADEPDEVETESSRDPTCSDEPSVCGADGRVPFVRNTIATDVDWAVSHLDVPDASERALAIVLRTQTTAGIAATRAFAMKPSKTRAIALSVLGYLRDHEAMSLFVDALRAQDASVRTAAAWSLGRFGPQALAADATLWELAATDPVFSVRCAAAESLGQIRGAHVNPAWVIADHELYAIGTPLPDGAAAEVGRRFCTSVVLEDGDLILFGVERGEFGGFSGFVPRANPTARPSPIEEGPGDPLQFVRVAGEVWLISGLSHLSFASAAVHRIRREPDGTLRAEKITSLLHVPRRYRVEDTTLILETDDGRTHRVRATY